MPQVIKIKRGTQANLLAASLQPYEMAFATDTKHMFIYDGAGKVLVGKALIDTLANRPSAGIPGRFFLATDDNSLYIDTGATWVAVSSAGGGGGSFSIEVTQFQPDDTNPASNRAVGALRTVAFSGSEDQVTWVQFTTDDNLDDTKDINLEITYCMSSSETGKKVSMNADVWVYSDGDDPQKTADASGQEDEITVPADDQLDKVALTNIKVPASTLSGVGQVVSIKLWRDADGTSPNHTGDIQIASVRAYQS